MHDLVSYNEKHNEANGEGGNDGESNNSSWNHGAEGETDDVEIKALREQQKRNMLTTLFLSQGVPMLLHGDELGRTQGGNNNVYAQDNEIAWIDWERATNFQPLTEFVGRLGALRQAHPILHRRRHFSGRGMRDEGLQDIGWFTPAGDWMTSEDWNTAHVKSVAVFLIGDAISEPDERGETVTDDSFFVLFNGHYEPIKFGLPDIDAGPNWTVEIDTAAPADEEIATYQAGDTIPVAARSILLLKKTG